MNNSFSTQLASIRLLRGYEQRDVARLSRINVTQISHFERGNRLPSAKSLLRLAEALEISTDFLLGRTEQITPIYVDEMRAGALVRACEGLMAIHVAGLVQMAEAMKGKKNA